MHAVSFSAVAKKHPCNMAELQHEEVEFSVCNHLAREYGCNMAELQNDEVEFSVCNHEAREI